MLEIKTHQYSQHGAPAPSPPRTLSYHFPTRQASCLRTPVRTSAPCQPRPSPARPFSRPTCSDQSVTRLWAPNVAAVSYYDYYDPHRTVALPSCNPSPRCQGQVSYNLCNNNATTPPAPLCTCAPAALLEPPTEAGTGPTSSSPTEGPFPSRRSASRMPPRRQVPRPPVAILEPPTRAGPDPTSPSTREDAAAPPCHQAPCPPAALLEAPPQAGLNPRASFPLRVRILRSAGTTLVRLPLPSIPNPGRP